MIFNTPEIGYLKRNVHTFLKFLEFLEAHSRKTKQFNQIRIGFRISNTENLSQLCEDVMCSIMRIAVSNPLPDLKSKVSVFVCDPSNFLERGLKF